METKLNDKQQLFCREYCVDLNGTQAAIRAGYAKGSARVTASKLMARADVRDFIAHIHKPHLDAVDQKAHDVIAELKLCAFGNMEDFVERNEDGELVNISIDDATRDQMAFISEISVDIELERSKDENDKDVVDRVRKVKLKSVPKLAALRMMAEHEGLLKPKGSEMDKLAEAIMKNPGAVLPPEAFQR